MYIPGSKISHDIIDFLQRLLYVAPPFEIGQMYLFSGMRILESQGFMGRLSRQRRPADCRRTQREQGTIQHIAKKTSFGMHDIAVRKYLLVLKARVDMFFLKSARHQFELG